jgi:hypothetical protein
LNITDKWRQAAAETEEEERRADERIAKRVEEGEQKRRDAARPGS